MNPLNAVPSAPDDEQLPEDGILGAETCPSCHTVTAGKACHYCDRDAEEQRSAWRNQP